MRNFNACHAVLTCVILLTLAACSRLSVEGWQVERAHNICALHNGVAYMKESDAMFMGLVRCMDGHKETFSDR